MAIFAPNRMLRMNKRHTPVNVNKETHLKLIIVLLCVVVVFGLISRCPVRAPRPVALPETTQSPSMQPLATEAAAPEKRSVAAIPEQTAPPARPERTETPASRIEHLERPACERTEFLVVNPAGRYALLYDTAYRQAAWVAYLLTRADVRSPGVKRGNTFRRDPEVLRRGWPSASEADYAGGPFDRGHLLPSADRRSSSAENRATFYFSNISPQYPSLNRKVWKNLEEQVRRWAERYDSLYVVTGPELAPDLARRPGGVGVPRRYFKALLVFSGGRCQALAFLIPNAEQVPGGFMDYALSVDELEAALGYDFFYRLPDSLERRAESRVDAAFWR